MYFTNKQKQMSKDINHTYSSRCSGGAREGGGCLWGGGTQEKNTGNNIVQERGLVLTD